LSETVVRDRGSEPTLPSAPAADFRRCLLPLSLSLNLSPTLTPAANHRRVGVQRNNLNGAPLGSFPSRNGYTFRMSVTSDMNIVGFLVVLLALPLGTAAGEERDDHSTVIALQEVGVSPFPIHQSVHYKVKCFGLTCGHLNLGSNLEEFNGHPAYHIVMTGRNSKFFNRIYKVETRIDSWVDAQTLSTLVYESVTTEKGETSRERFELDREEGTIYSIEDGVEKSTNFDCTEPVLDPLAFVFRLQALAKPGGDDITLTLMTDKGPVKTISTVLDPRSRRTSQGRRQLLEIQPHPVDGKLFSQKGQFSLWVDPNTTVKLYALDFKLSFGHLIARLDP